VQYELISNAHFYMPNWIYKYHLYNDKELRKNIKSNMTEDLKELRYEEYEKNDKRY
jgi:hypothetical protein